MDMYQWTRHAEWKMREYGLSQQRLKRVIRHPDRVEKSIVPKMVAAMQIAGTSKNRYEIWVMYTIVKSEKLKVKSGGKEMQNDESGMQNGEQGRQGTKETGYNGVKFQGLKFNAQNLSPAARFRMERRREFEAKINAGGTGGKTIRIISAWRYPGTSPKRDPIPSEILEEIRDLVR